MKKTMLKRIMSLQLCLCMLLSYVPATVFAAEADGLCSHHETHTDDCGYAPAVEGSDCTHECGEDCAEGCIHTEHDEACGYQEAVAEQPCVFAEGCETCVEEEAAKKAAEEEAAKASAEAVESVRALIEELPSLEELEAMSWEAQQEAYADTQAADEAYQALTDAQKAELTEENAKLDELFGYFNTLTEPTETYSGMCGPNAYWSFDSETGTLTISGQYQINDYDEIETPWYKAGLDPLITKVVIEEGITIIGAYAFDAVENLKTVYLPKSLTTIDDGAFRINLNSDPVISDVYYAGTSALWNNVSVSSYGPYGNENDYLLKATFHYAYLCTEEHTWTNGTSSKVCSVCGETAPFEGYNLWVNGVAVNEGNASDITGDGKVSYDANSNTLSLNNANITKATDKDTDGHPCAILYTGTTALTISATGSNSINTINNGVDSAGGAGSYGIYSAADLHLTGTGYLYVQGSTAIGVEGKLYIGTGFESDTQSLSLHLRANSFLGGKFAEATSVKFPCISRDDEGEAEYDRYYAFRSSETAEFDNYEPSATKFFEIKGSGHATTYVDNGDTTHKVKCACGEELISRQNHSINTSCVCGIAQAVVNTDYQYAAYEGTAYRNLHEAIKAAADTTGTQTVHIGTMSLTEDATVAADDRLKVGAYYSEGNTLTIDAATLTLSSGSTFVISKNTITYANGGKIVDLGTTAIAASSFIQHTHTIWKYTDNGDGTHSRTSTCNICNNYTTPVVYYDGSDPAAHGGWKDGLCGDCGAACEHNYSESVMCSICGNSCLHPEKDEDGVCPDCGFAPVAKVTVGEEYWLFATMTEAMAAVPTDGSTKATVTLLANATEAITVDGGVDVVLEGGAYSLTVSSGNAITMEGGKLEIASGTFETTATTGRGVSVSGGQLTVSGGTVIGGKYGIYNRSNQNVTVSGGEVKATGTDAYGIYNEATGGVTVSGAGKVTGGAYGVYNYHQYGTVTVTGGTLTGTSYALYNFAGSEYVRLSGGIYLGGIYSGYGNIVGGNMEDLLKDGYQYASYDSSSSAVGDAIDLSSKVNYSEDLTVVCAHTLTHDNNKAATCKAPAYCGNCGQSYGEKADHTIDNATGYCVYECGQNMAKVSVTVGTATTYYTKVTEALASEAVTNMTSGQTAAVKLLDSFTEEASLQITTKPLVLDLNGKTLSVWSVSVSGAGANLTVKDSTASAEGVLKTKHNVAVSSGAVLTLESGTINAQVTSSSFTGGINVSGGTLNITGGTLISGDHGIYVIDSATAVNISSGTIQDSGAEDKYALYNRVGSSQNIALSGGIFLGGIFASESSKYISDLLADGYKYANYDTTSGIGDDFDVDCYATGGNLAVVCLHKNLIHTADEATNTITATCANTTCYKYGEEFGTLVLRAADCTYNSEVYEAYEATVTGTGIYADTTLTADYAQDGNALVGVPSKAGSFTASLTVDGVTVSDNFVVEQATLTPSITGAAVKNYDGTKQVTEGQLSINLTGICGQDSVQATATFLYGQTGVGEEITVTAGDIQLTGTDAGNYKLSTNLVTARVGTIEPKAVTEVTFPNTLPVVYGVTLGDVGFTGGNGNGTFAWADVDLKPEVSNEGYTMIFTPADTKNYDYSNVAGWNADTKTVVRNVAIQVSKANPAIGTVSAADVKDTLDITKVKLTRSSTAVAGTLTLNDGQTLKLGENTLAYTFTPGSGNYKVVGGTVTVNVVDTIAPTGTVTLAENTWNKFLSKITFGLFFNKTQTVTATAADSLSGVASIEYHATGKGLDLAGVKALADSKWTQMNSGKVNITAEDAKQFIYYIRITDKAGNVTYLATNGAEFDTTAPVITGVEDGETYTKTREVTVTDKNLKSVTLNGETVTGTITLTCAPDVEQEYTIVAADKAGNTTTVKVTMAAVCDGGENCPCAPYGDVDTSLWYHEAIDYVIENGLMQGHPGKVFAPDETLTRAQMVQILYNLEGRPAVSGKDSYTDTDPSEWYTDAILWATRKGIVEGYGGGKFGPSDPLTREQMVTILYRYSQYKGYDLSAGSYSSFPDAGDVSDYAKTPMAWAIGKGVIIGMDDGTLCPGCKSTRAQVATVLMRYVEMFK